MNEICFGLKILPHLEGGIHHYILQKERKSLWQKSNSMKEPLTIESKFTRAALVEIYREEPDVLNLKDEDGDAYFYVGVTGTTGVSSGSGGISRAGSALTQTP